jgi:hypothetical protein
MFEPVGDGVEEFGVVVGDQHVRLRQYRHIGQSCGTTT